MSSNDPAQGEPASPEVSPEASDDGLQSRPALVPGEILTAEELGDIPINVGRLRTTLTVENTGDRPIQVGSHYHFFEVNQALRLNRAKAHGMRLDIPAGTAVRFEPGQSREVTLVALAGRRHVYGFQGLVMGPLDS